MSLVQLASRIGAVIAVLKTLLAYFVPQNSYLVTHQNWDCSGTKTFKNNDPSFVYVIRDIYFSIVTDANVADRYFKIIKTNQDGEYLFNSYSKVVPASYTGNFSANPNVPYSAPSSITSASLAFGQLPLGSGVLRYGESFIFDWFNQQAGDVGSIMISYTKVKIND